MAVGSTPAIRDLQLLHELNGNANRQVHDTHLLVLITPNCPMYYIYIINIYPHLMRVRFRFWRLQDVQRNWGSTFSPFWISSTYSTRLCRPGPQCQTHVPLWGCLSADQGWPLASRMCFCWKMFCRWGFPLLQLQMSQTLQRWSPLEEDRRHLTTQSLLLQSHHNNKSKTLSDHRN